MDPKQIQPGQEVQKTQFFENQTGRNKMRKAGGQNSMPTEGIRRGILKAALEICEWEAWSLPFTFNEMGLEIRGLSSARDSLIELTIPGFKGNGTREVELKELLKALKGGKRNDIVKLRLNGDLLEVIADGKTTAVETQSALEKEEVPILTLQYAATALLPARALAKAMEEAKTKAKEEWRAREPNNPPAYYVNALEIEVNDTIYIRGVHESGKRGPTVVVKPIKLDVTTPIKAKYGPDMVNITKIGARLSDVVALKIATKMRAQWKQEWRSVYEKELKVLTLEYEFDGGRLTIHRAPMVD